MLQNGVDSERVSAILGKQQTIPGTAFIAAVLGGPGVMLHTSVRDHVGRRRARSGIRKLAALGDAAKAAGRHPAADWRTANGGRSSSSCVNGGRETSTRFAIGKVLADPDTRAFNAS